MEISDEDLVARGRSIFDQLRADRGPSAVIGEPDPVTDGEPAPALDDPTALTVPVPEPPPTAAAAVAPPSTPTTGASGAPAPGRSESFEPERSDGHAPDAAAPGASPVESGLDPPAAEATPTDVTPASGSSGSVFPVEAAVAHPPPGSEHPDAEPAHGLPETPQSPSPPVHGPGGDNDAPLPEPQHHPVPEGPAAEAQETGMTESEPGGPPGDGAVPLVGPAAGEDLGADLGGSSAPPPFHVEPGSAAARPAADPVTTPPQFHVEQAVVEPLPLRPSRALPRVMAVANQKGGVGKTTTAVNLAAALAELGYRTLVVDLDPQGNATTGLGVNARELDASVYDVLMRDLPVEDAIEPTSVRNLFVVPATIDLAGAEIELVPAFSRELKLKRALDGVADDFDFTLIDCPPSLGLLTVNALAAATEVVVPVQCEYYALEGLSALLRNVQLVQTNLNRDLEMSTIILTMYDARTKLAEQVATEVRLHFGNVVCRHMVPRTVRLSEAPSYGQPIIVFDPTSRGAIAYRELAKEVSGGTPQRVG